MEALAVIKHFDLVEHGLSGLGSGSIGLVMYQLGFQGMKEAFRDDVVPAIAFTAHALLDTVLL